MGGEVTVVSVGVVIVVVAAGMATATFPTKGFSKRKDTQVMGEVLVSQKVQTNIECSAICTAMDCLGYTLSSSSDCTTYSSIASYSHNPDARLYYPFKKLGEDCSSDLSCVALPDAACLNGTCSCVAPTYNFEGECIFFSLGTPCSFDEQCLGAVNNSACLSNTCQCSYASRPTLGNTTCEYAPAKKGEACILDSQCTLTDYTICLNTTQVCGCHPGALEAGNNCTTLSLGETCNSTTQCLLRINNSTCDVTCKCADKFYASEDRLMCKYDYAAGGFTQYGDRWTLFLITVVPMTSDAVWLFCWIIQAKMFTPRNANEFNLMKQKAYALNLLGAFHMPINNKAGALLWNNGSSALGVSFLPWKDGQEGYVDLLKGPLFPNCGYMDAFLNVLTLATTHQMKLVSCTSPLVTMLACEAEIN